jgi:hypothetical protein
LFNGTEKRTGEIEGKDEKFVEKYGFIVELVRDVGTFFFV